MAKSPLGAYSERIAACQDYEQLAAVSEELRVDRSLTLQESTDLFNLIGIRRVQLHRARDREESERRNEPKVAEDAAEAETFGGKVQWWSGFGDDDEAPGRSKAGPKR